MVPTPGPPIPTRKNFYWNINQSNTGYINYGDQLESRTINTDQMYFYDENGQPFTIPSNVSSINMTITMEGIAVVSEYAPYALFSMYDSTGPIHQIQSTTINYVITWQMTTTNISAGSPYIYFVWSNPTYQLLAGRSGGCLNPSPYTTDMYYYS